jgi:hypothetical protein
MLVYDNIITDQPMDTDELVAELEKILDVRIPKGTLRRWAWEGLISGPTPYGRKGQRGGCFYSWPSETVEDAAVIYTLRNSDLPWGETIRGWPTTKNGTEIKTISKKMLLETKKIVKHLYASVNKEEFESADFNDVLLLSKAVKVPKGYMFGSFATHPIFISWVTTLEKIRKNKPLRKPLQVVFNWRFHLVHEGGEESLKLKYDGITVKPSEEETVKVSVGKYTPEAWLKRFGTGPIDWEEAKRGGHVMRFDERFVKMQNDGEQQQVIWRDPFTGITIPIKKADPAEWGPHPPWENDDLSTNSLKTEPHKDRKKSGN